MANGEEALVDGLPRDASQGAPTRVCVTRSAIAETGRFKLARTRPTKDAPRPAPSLADRLRQEGEAVRIVTRFPIDEWGDLIMSAWDGNVAFDGGSLTITPTPAMTLVDIDGTMAPRQLAMAAIPSVAEAIRMFDLSGSIGIDFPSLSDKSDRRAVDDALVAALADWPHERTAMNGFGFVQLVARLERPSILQRVQHDQLGAAARLLLRRAEHVEHPGELLLTANPRVMATITPEWRTELARRTGRIIHWQEDPTLELSAGFAQAIAQ